MRQNGDMYFKNREESKKGSTLVIVVCVSAFLMAFALAMLYTAGLLLSRANRRLEQERGNCLQNWRNLCGKMRRISES